MSFSVYWDWIAPQAPKLLSLREVSPTSFVLSWEKQFRYRVTGCELQIAYEPGFTNLVAGYDNRSLGPTNEVLVSELAAGLTYYYRVRATNEAAFGPYSGTNSVTLPAQLTLAGIARRGVTLRLPGKPGQTYQIQRATILTPVANWQNSGLPVKAPDDGQLEFTVDAEEPMPPAAFYRLQLVEPQNP